MSDQSRELDLTQFAERSWPDVDWSREALVLAIRKDYVDLGPVIAWGVVALVGLLAMLVLWRLVKRLIRRRRAVRMCRGLHTKCPSCRYALKGEASCPECGFESGPKAVRWWPVAAVAGLFVVLVGAAITGTVRYSELAGAVRVEWMGGYEWATSSEHEWVRDLTGQRYVLARVSLEDPSEVEMVASLDELPLFLICGGEGGGEWYITVSLEQMRCFDSNGEAVWRREVPVVKHPPRGLTTNIEERGYEFAQLDGDRDLLYVDLIGEQARAIEVDTGRARPAPWDSMPFCGTSFARGRSLADISTKLEVLVMEHIEGIRVKRFRLPEEVFFSLPESVIQVGFQRGWSLYLSDSTGEVVSVRLHIPPGSQNRGFIDFWDLEEGFLEGRSLDLPRVVSTGRLSNSGDWLVVANRADGSVFVIDAVNRTLDRELSYQTSGNECRVFISPDGKRVVVVELDGKGQVPVKLQVPSPGLRPLPAPPVASKTADIPEPEPPQAITAEDLDWGFDADVAAKVQMRAARDLDIPRELSIDLGEGEKVRLVLIPPGRFVMGATIFDDDHLPKRHAQGLVIPPIDESQHVVTLTAPYYMGVTEVTQSQWDAVMTENPSFEKRGEDHPVSDMTWNEAVAFCERVSKRTGVVVRLPTEAEWEWACRAGTTGPYSWGDEWVAGVCNAENAQITLPSEGDGADSRRPGSRVSNVELFIKRDLVTGGTMPVATFAPNAWGLYDMHGNVSEWCQDFLGPYPKDSVVDPGGPHDGITRIFRGGGYLTRASRTRSGCRAAAGPEFRYVNAGVRVVVPLQGAESLLRRHRESSGVLRHSDGDE